MRLTFTWDDGALEDQRLFELHERYEIPGMFFIPTRNREGREVITPEIMRTAESSCVSFGGHTQNHAFLTLNFERTSRGSAASVSSGKIP